MKRSLGLVFLLVFLTLPGSPAGATMFMDLRTVGAGDCLVNLETIQRALERWVADPRNQGTSPSIAPGSEFVQMLPAGFSLTCPGGLQGSGQTNSYLIVASGTSHFPRCPFHGTIQDTAGFVGQAEAARRLALMREEFSSTGEALLFFHLFFLPVLWLIRRAVRSEGADFAGVKAGACLFLGIAVLVVTQGYFMPAQGRVLAAAFHLLGLAFSWLTVARQAGVLRRGTGMILGFLSALFLVAGMINGLGLEREGGTLAGGTVTLFAGFLVTALNATGSGPARSCPPGTSGDERPGS